MFIPFWLLLIFASVVVMYLCRGERVGDFTPLLGLAIVACMWIAYAAYCFGAWLN